MKTFPISSETFLPVYPITLAYAYSQEAVHRPNGAPMHQIFIVNNGEGVLTLRNAEIPLHRGSMIFLKQGEPHSYHGGEDFQTDFLGFRGKICADLLAYFGIRQSEVFSPVRDCITQTRIKNFTRDFSSVSDEARLSSAAYDIVTSFFSEVLRTEKLPIEHVKTYLEANFAHPITLADCMEIYPYSKAKLCRDFKAYYHMTVFEMLTKIRLSHAEILLCTGPHTKLEQIAKQCGFTDTCYFCKVYKRAFGRTPRGR